MTARHITVGPRNANPIRGVVWPVMYGGYQWGSVSRAQNGDAPYWVKVDGTSASVHATLAEAREVAIKSLNTYLDNP